MANYSQSRLERVYLQINTTAFQVPNSGGTPTIGNSHCCRHIKVDLNNDVSMLVRRDKTGSRTATQGVAGRRTGSWNMELSLSPNGTVAVAPDMSVLLQATFGQSPTVVAAATTAAGSSTSATPVVLTVTGHGLGSAGTYHGVYLSGHSTDLNGAWVAKVVDANSVELQGSVTAQGGGTGGTLQKGSVKYSFSDDIKDFSLFRYRSPSTLNQQIGVGCVVTSATFPLGADIVEPTFEGECHSVIDSDRWSTLSTTEKAGLTSLVSEPASPVTNGGIIAGFTGKFVADGESLASIRTGQLRISPGNVVVKDLFGSYFADSAEGEERDVRLSFSMYEDDSAGQQALRDKGVTKESFDAVMQLGTVAGSTVLFFVRGIQLPSHQTEDGQRRFINNYNDARAYGSSITAKDEVTMWFV